MFVDSVREHPSECFIGDPAKMAIEHFIAESLSFSRQRSKTRRKLPQPEWEPTQTATTNSADEQ
ncbi:hypothetical protein [Rosistilla oblonga]|uniref:hypothetical protein n=1 Tax=Rosistilla oblonga TaxID=2527990 RepID=UPI0018D27372|nr:hypothetical protein [Rosistilla oblonga]